MSADGKLMVEALILFLFFATLAAYSVASDKSFFVYSTIYKKDNPRTYWATVAVLVLCAAFSLMELIVSIVRSLR